MFHIGCPQRTLVLGLLLSATGYSQSKPSQPAYPKLLPYSFSNFVWWSDDELRTALKRRIPGLQDEIAPTLSTPSGVRTVADALSVVPASESTLADEVIAACKSALAGEGSVALIAADDQVAALRDAISRMA